MARWGFAQWQPQPPRVANQSFVVAPLCIFSTTCRHLAPVLYAQKAISPRWVA